MGCHINTMIFLIYNNSCTSTHITINSNNTSTNNNNNNNNNISGLTPSDPLSSFCKIGLE